MFKKLGLLALAPALLLSCGGQKQYRFVGRVFDGVTGAQIKKYTIELGYLNNRNKGEVDKNGHYILPSLPSMHDFTVVVTGAGDYREFYSVNQGWSDFGQGKQTGAATGRTNNYHSTTNSTTEPNYPRGYDLPESYEYDVYLFPKGLKAPATEINLFLSDVATRPATGTVRLVPTTATSNIQYAAPSIGGQAWANTADLQFGVVSGTITNGVVSIPEGTLMYGVTYTITVFGVPGYGVPAAVTGFVAGAANSIISFTLLPLTEIDSAASATLKLIYSSASSPTPDSTATLTLVFDQDIEIYTGVSSLASQLTLVEDSLSTTGLVEVQGTGNSGAAAFKDITAAGVQCGTNAVASGPVLTLTIGLQGCLLAAPNNIEPKDGIKLNWFTALGNLSVRPLKQGTNAASQVVNAVSGVTAGNATVLVQTRE